MRESYLRALRKGTAAPPPNSDRQNSAAGDVFLYGKKISRASPLSLTTGEALVSTTSGGLVVPYSKPRGLDRA